ncbi:MAG: ABC transporter ATP-binding protein [Saprospiraceae bacterium]
MSHLLLDIQQLHIAFKGHPAPTEAVRGLSLHIRAGESVGLVGESGSGKSVTALSILRLLPKADLHGMSGQIHYTPDPDTRVSLLDDDLSGIRGKEIAMIFQEPMSSLNPVMRCGLQVTEAIRHHLGASKNEAREQTLELFEQVRLPDPARAFRAYPHELSGGQKQRVMIAMALSCKPRLLLADEPTTALDVTVQKGILDLLDDIRAARGLAMLFISHDLGVVRRITDRVAVLYRGELQEEGPTADVLRQPRAPYTRGLLASRPRMDVRYERMPTVADFEANPDFAPQTSTRPPANNTPEQSPLLRVEHLSVRFPKRKNVLGVPVEWTQAVNDVSFDLFPGECLGLAGESGCGKTTLGRAIARLVQAEKGRVVFRGDDWSELSGKALRQQRQHMQVVFQDPYASLNPRMRIGDAIGEPMLVHGLAADKKACKAQVIALLEQVGLQADHYGRYPHAFSGGQRQRIGIARALALQPALLICDEIVSALDVSVQATILNLLADLQQQFGLSYLFISHDLSVIHQLCDRVLVMQSGAINAEGTPQSLFQAPPTAYVQSLMDAVLY